MKYFLFDGQDSRQFKIKIIDVIRPFYPNNRDHYETIPGKHGQIRYPQPLGDKTITFVCLLDAHSIEERTQIARDIPAWFYHAGTAPLILPDESDVYYLGELESMEEPENIALKRNFTFKMTVRPFKISRAVNRKVERINSNTTISVYSKGTVETAPTIVLKAVAGDIEQPQITINDQFLKYTGTLTNNSSIEFNLENFYANVSMERDINTTGAYDSNEGNILQFVEGEFGLLKSKANTIGYRSNNNIPAELSIIWNDQYI